MSLVSRPLRMSSILTGCPIFLELFSTTERFVNNYFRSISINLATIAISGSRQTWVFYSDFTKGCIWVEEMKRLSTLEMERRTRNYKKKSGSPLLRMLQVLETSKKGIKTCKVVFFVDDRKTFVHLQFVSFLHTRLGGDFGEIQNIGLNFPHSQKTNSRNFARVTRISTIRQNQVGL